MNDDLKKLGYRLRPRVVEQKQPGRIAFDERGNAVYEWNDDRCSEDGEAGERARRKALDHPGLSFMEEEQPANAPIQNNAKGRAWATTRTKAACCRSVSPPRRSATCASCRSGSR